MYGYICCAGSRSCMSADNIESYLGNIFCTATQSCYNAFISNTDDDIIEGLSVGNNGNIYCLAPGSCEQSRIETYNSLYCLSSHSCKNSDMTKGDSIYCTMGACNSAQISNIKNVYLFDKQPGLVIKSDNIGEMTVHLRGSNSGSNVVINCFENDFCTIDCGTTRTVNSNSCQNLEIYCDGKCDIKCNETIGIACPIIKLSVAPTIAPTITPTNAPTVAPTQIPTGTPTITPTAIPTYPTGEPTNTPTLAPGGVVISEAFITENDVETTMTYVLIVIGSIAACIVFAGLIDSHMIRKNDWFDVNAILVFGFYTADFISDVFFSAKLVLMIDRDDNVSNEYYVTLFILSAIFIILPLVVNIFQLQIEIKKWTIIKDKNENKLVLKRHAEMYAWIKSKIKVIYFVTLIAGSSFSSIALFNSYLFRLNIFSMGLTKKQIAVFQNKRIFSVVLMEVSLYTYTV